MLVQLATKIYFGPIRLMIKLAFWLVLLAIIGILVFSLTFDLNRFKKKIETEAAIFLKTDVTVNGDIKVGIEKFRPSAILHDVQVGRKGSGTVILLDSLEVTIPPGIALPWKLGLVSSVVPPSMMAPCTPPTSSTAPSMMTIRPEVSTVKLIATDFALTLPALSMTA